MGLGAIARIRRGYVDLPVVKVLHQGKEVIAFDVSIVKSSDTIKLGKLLQALTVELSKTLPAGIKLVQVQDQPAAVSQSVNELVGVLIEAVGIVPGFQNGPQCRASCCQSTSTLTSIFARARWWASRFRWSLA